MPNESHPNAAAAKTDAPAVAPVEAAAPPAEAPAKPPRTRRKPAARDAAGRYTSNRAAADNAGAGNPTAYYARNYARNRQQAKKSGADFLIPWWLVVLAFLFATPLGIGLLVLNLVLANRGKFAAGKPRTAARSGQPIYAPAAQAQHQPDAKRLADGLTVAAVVLTVLGGLACMGAVFSNLWMLTDYGDIAWFLEEVWPLAILLFGGIGCGFAAHRVRTGWLMRNRIGRIVGDADHCYIEDIAAVLGCDTEKCIDHLENCITKGVFGPDAYLDMRSMALVVRGAAPAPKQPPAAKAEPDPQPETAARPEETRYDKILKELRRINDSIPDQEMNAKIGRLETVAGKIFAQLQDDPDQLPQLRKFMDYYLPTSLKLLDTYAELEAQGVEGANISESKRRIERSMDTLVTAFENQLDKMFQSDALDVSTDIEVMEKMLSADGLVGDSDPFGLHGGKQG